MELDATDDSDYVDLGGADFDAEVEWRKDVELSPNDENISEVCFDHFFSRTKEHSKLVDECHSSRRLPHCSTVKKKIK